MRTLVFSLGLTALLATVGCAGQTCKECPASPKGAADPAGTRVKNELLTDLLPATARAALVVRQSSLTSFTAMLTDDPPTRSELARFLTRTVGADLTRIQGLVLFVRALQPPSGAVLLRLPSPAEPRGQAAGEHRGTRLVRLGGPDQMPVLGAAHPGGLVIGTKDAVQAALDVAGGAARPTGADDPLAPVLAADSDGTGVLAGMVSDLLPAGPRAGARRFGIRSGVLTLESGRSVVLRIDGEGQRLDAGRKLLLVLLRGQLAKLERRKNEATSRGDIAEGISSISSYHTLRRLVDEAQPRMVDGHLELRYQLPPADSAYVYAGVVGILAAVAIPAFIKYTRKAKTVEALEGLDKITAGAKAYHAADHHGRAGRRLPRHFPPSVGWTPATPCCQHKGGKCQPDPAAWSHPTWHALHFQPTDPHHYQFRFTSQGKGKSARFEVEARGDLDCDGTYSSYRLMGEVDAAGDVTRKGPVIENEIE